MVLNNKRLQSNCLYLEKNLIYLPSDSIVIDLENLYVQKNKSRNLMFWQEQFSLQLSFEMPEGRISFMEQVSIYVIQLNLKNSY